MTDMPERIWATPEDGYCTTTDWPGDIRDALGFVEFIRADAVQSRIDAAVLAEREACAVKLEINWGHKATPEMVADIRERSHT